MAFGRIIYCQLGVDDDVEEEEEEGEDDDDVYSIVLLVCVASRHRVTTSLAAVWSTGSCGFVRYLLFFAVCFSLIDVLWRGPLTNSAYLHPSKHACVYSLSFE